MGASVLEDRSGGTGGGTGPIRKKVNSFDSSSPSHDQVILVKARYEEDRDAFALLLLILPMLFLSTGSVLSPSTEKVCAGTSLKN